MKLYANQLSQQLKQGLDACYMLFGDEPFQIDDSRKQIKALARSQGVDEFIRLVDDDQFDWAELLDHCQAMSLFSSRKLIELELTSGKLNKQASDIIQQVAGQLSQDTILVIFGPKLEQNQTRAAWFKALDKQGCYIPVYEIEGQHLRRWLQQQLQQRNLQMTPDAQNYLLELTAGNLLACSQELEKITMANTAAFIDITDVEKLVADQSRFSVFQLMDQLWLGNSEKCLTMINRLQSEEVEPNILIWSMQKDVTLVQQLVQAKQFNLDTKPILDSHRVWKNKQQQFINAANKLPIDVVNKALEYLSQIDQGLKQSTVAAPYSLFAHIALMLTGKFELAQLPLPIVSGD